MAYESDASTSGQIEAAPDQAVTASLFTELDRVMRGRFAAMTGGQSPWAAIQAWEDWAFHLSVSPGKQAELAWSWSQLMADLARSSFQPDEQWAIAPEPSDRRFRGEAWSTPPFKALAQWQLALEQQWKRATTGVRGVADHHANRARFMGEHVLNAMAPVNFPATNPEVLNHTVATAGGNFATGAALFMDDVARFARGEKLKGMESWQVGKTMALTKGKVVFRNRLFELIQYAPRTAKVRREPILIVPAWIMKFYILDLTEQDSLVRWLVDRGHTVFIMSWKNPGPESREESFDNYRADGVMQAIDTVSHIVEGEKIHAVGYCLGGTVLAIAAAAMDRDDDDRLSSLSLLAAQTDFEEAGELLMFIDPSQLALLEDMMHVAGYLDARGMAGAFYALRANELLYARLVERYFLGNGSKPQALDAWLADPTRMPARMHSEYLRGLFMENRLAHGRYEVDGSAVALMDIRTPTFSLGAERDHIAPWRSVYKIRLYSPAESTFVLTGGGHNSSVVSPPHKPRAYYWISHRSANADYVDPDRWLLSSPQESGSWWPAWEDWLVGHGSDGKVDPPPMGTGDAPASLVDAPGEYGLEV